MRTSRFALSACLAGALASCGGGGGGGGGPIGGGGGGGGGGAPTPAPSSGACSLSARQDWVKQVIDEWYLFPTLVAAGVNKANYNDVQSYVDALVAPARAQSMDRYFTYITSIAEENALINSGATAGFGFRLGYATGANRVFIIESFEGAPAFGQGIGRGDELLMIAGQSVASLMAGGGPQAVINALGPDTPGTSRTLRIQDIGGPQRDVTLSKTNFNLDPISPTYGAKVFDDGGTKVGYLNMRTFIASTADAQLRAAFQTFKNQGVTRVIVDLRYNGGGLVSIAELFGDLLLSNRVGQVFSYTTFRDSKAAENETDTIGGQSQAIAPVKIAFIGTGSSASASELLMNAMPPYLAGNVALIGSNTYGKPVGQIAADLATCDDRLRVVAFKTENADHEGEYFTGLADTMPATCRATDDISHELGDADEAMIAEALDWLRGGSCTAISSVAKTTQQVSERRVLQPDSPNAAQQYLPGLF